MKQVLLATFFVLGMTNFAMAETEQPKFDAKVKINQILNEMVWLTIEGDAAGEMYKQLVRQGNKVKVERDDESWKVEEIETENLTCRQITGIGMSEKFALVRNPDDRYLCSLISK